MIKSILFLIISLLLTAALAGAMDRVEDPKTCRQCGMDRTTFAHSRMLLEYVDESSSGVCSLHCAALELHHNNNKQLSALMVADYTTKKLLDAKSAVWVVGGRKAGVMTAQPKWAFAGIEDARKFMKEHGGSFSTFDQAKGYAINEVMEQAAEELAVERELLREQQ
jgi:nitrous oxide reductase accessory protein NosL